MGSEGSGFQKVRGPVGPASEEANSVKENGEIEEGAEIKECIKLVSHGDETVKKEENGVVVANFPKDAVEEWPEPKKIHSFYFVKYRIYDDLKLKAKIEQVKVEFWKHDEARCRLVEAVREKKLVRGDLDGARKELQAVNSKIQQQDGAIEAVKKQISSIEAELKIVSDKKDQALHSVNTFRQQLDEQVGNFMSRWNSKKEFRDDYVKRIMWSLDSRKLSRDGRMRNRDEKPLMAPEVSALLVVESATKANAKLVKEDATSAVAPLDSFPLKVEKEAKSEAALPKSTVDYDEEIYRIEKPKVSEVDEEKSLKLTSYTNLFKKLKQFFLGEKRCQMAPSKDQIKCVFSVSMFIDETVYKKKHGTELHRFI